MEAWQEESFRRNLKLFKESTLKKAKAFKTIYPKYSVKVYFYVKEGDINERLKPDSNG